MSNHRTNIILRVIFNLILFLGVFVMPFWLFAVLALVGLAYFRSFYEFIAGFMMRDFLYGAPEARFGGFVYVLTVISILAFIAADFIKKKILL